MSGAEGVAQLHSDVDDITSALQTLLEKREMYASMLAKLDTEEHGVVRRLQDGRARIGGLAALGLEAEAAAAASAAAGGTSTSEHAPTPRPRGLGTISRDAAWDHLAECCPPVRAQPALVGAVRRQLAGPATEDVCTLGTAIAARTISTYPMNADRTKRVCFFFLTIPSSRRAWESVQWDVHSLSTSSLFPCTLHVHVYSWFCVVDDDAHMKMDMDGGTNERTNTRTPTHSKDHRSVTSTTW